MGRPRLYSDEERKERARAQSLQYYHERAGNHRKASRKYERSHSAIVAERKRQWRANNPNYNDEYRADKVNRLKILVNAARQRCRVSGVPFDLTWEDLGTIPDICPVLGIKIEMGSGFGFHPNSPSLDRFDQALGYVAGNVRVISLRANILKRDATIAELEAVLAYMKSG